MAYLCDKPCICMVRMNILKQVLSQSYSSAIFNTTYHLNLLHVYHQHININEIFNLKQFHPKHSNLFSRCHFPTVVTLWDSVLNMVTQPKQGLLQERSCIMQCICTCYIYSSEAGSYFDQSVARPLHHISLPARVISTAEALNTPRCWELWKTAIAVCPRALFCFWFPTFLRFYDLSSSLMV